MNYDSLLGRQELFVATAVIGSHATSSEEGFRQRDVRFLIELFSNWVEHGQGDVALAVNNTQVARYIQRLVDDGYARKISRKGNPRYRLTRVGLIELVSRCVNRTYLGQRNQFFFLFYFIRNYKPRLTALVEAEGRQFPPALRIELDELLNEEALVKREQRAVKAELTRLKERMAGSKQASSYLSGALARGESLETAVKEIQRRWPYELNSRRPLSELIAGIPKDFRRWEIEVGNLKRADEIFGPGHSLLRAYDAELQALLKGAGQS